jgi:hypothetical protein
MVVRTVNAEATRRSTQSDDDGPTSASMSVLDRGAALTRESPTGSIVFRRSQAFYWSWDSPRRSEEVAGSTLARSRARLLSTLPTALCVGPDRA